LNGKGHNCPFQESQNLGFDTIPKMPTSNSRINELDVGIFFCSNSKCE